MPIDKNKLVRFQTLDRCFADVTKKYFMDDLQSACRDALRQVGAEYPDVSRRTIYNDIHEMECNKSWNVFLVEKALDGKRRYFRYSDPTYRIWSNDLDESELNQLKSILLMIKQFSGIPQFDKMEEVIEQLQEKYNFSLPDSDQVVGFDHNPYVKGIEYISVLYSYIVSKSVAEIQYQPYNKELVTYIFHPYFIKQYNNRWFVWGMVNGETNLYNLALDRIKNIQPSSEKYISSDIDFNEYLEDVIGVTKKSDKIEKIHLQFTEYRFPYVVSKPLHWSQRIIDPKNRIIEISVIENLELYQHLLSFGYDVEVLSPSSIKDKMISIIDKMSDNYKIRQEK